MYSREFEQKIFPILRKKQLELAIVPPQSLGPLTSYYHRIVPTLKIAPWRLIAVGALVSTVGLRVLLGSAFVRLASLLQWGF